MRGLEGKVAVVAGGATGIGAATARRFAEEGVRVVVGDLDGAGAEATATAIGRGAIGVEFDIADEGGVDALFAAATATFGGFDLVHVNAADLSPGTIGRDGDVLDLPLEVLDRTIAVNLRGHVLVTRRALPTLLERRGALVYTSSAAAFVGEPSRPSYAMAKNGLHGLVRHVSARWGHEGLRANAVAPGLVPTDAMLASDEGGQLQQYALALGRSPRLGRPDDIAAAVAFLCSDDAEWINGQVLSVDGGATVR
ncbi:MAG: fabG 14 [Actinomycetia bacterium]|nr:fabG 14 [Actinomycetes bacterium]